MKRNRRAVDFGVLVKDLLNIDPEMLALMGSSEDNGNDRILTGLGALMRRSMELVLLLRDQDDLELHLKTPASAKAWGFPDVATANFAVLWVWASITADRYCGGKSYAPLFPANHTTIDLPPPSDLRTSRLTASELVDEFCKPTPEVASDDSADEELMSNAPGTWIRGAVRSILRFDPAELAAGLYDTKEEAAAALVTESDAQACVALMLFGKEVLRHYCVMRHRKTSKIRLRTEADAIDAELPNAHVANLMTILAASLRADDKQRVKFLPPQERSDADRLALRAAARVLYRDYSFEKHEKFQDLVEANRHFGTTRKYGLSSRILHSVSREVDPLLERMPMLVRGIEAGLARPSMYGFRVKVV